MSAIKQGCCIEYTIDDIKTLQKLRLQCKNSSTRCFLRCPVWDQSTHHFPNHKKHRDRFKAWVEAIGRKLETDEDYEYFRTKRLCHIHFKPIFCYYSNRLSPLAIPTLYLTKESRDEYWSKDLELRKSMLQQSKSPQDETPTDVAERLKDEVDAPKDEVDAPKDEVDAPNDEVDAPNDEVDAPKDEVDAPKDEVDAPKDEVDAPKDEVDAPKHEIETNKGEPVIDVPEDKLPSSDLQSSLQSDVQDSLENLLIADILEGENVNYADDIEENPMIELSIPSPVESNVPNPVADIIIEYVPVTEDSEEKLLIKNIPRDITREVVQSLPPELNFNHDLPVDSTLMKTSAMEIKIKKNRVQNCIQQPKKKRQCNYDGITWEMGPRIPMEHNYSKASIVGFSSHISSNGMHPKKTIIALKKQVRELRKNIKLYKQRCIDVLLKNPNHPAVTKQKISKMVTKTSQKGQASHKKVYKNVINYLNVKNVGSGISLPRNV